MFKNSTETKGLTVENQTKGLNSVNNNVKNAYDATTSIPKDYCEDDMQKVLLRCKRDVAVMLMNNLLKNVGESVQLTSMDNWDRIRAVWTHLDETYSLKLHHLLGKDKQPRNKDRHTANISLRKICVSEEWAVLEIFVDSGDRSLWTKIINLYPYSRMVSDRYVKKHTDFSNEGILVYCDSIYIKNYGEGTFSWNTYQCERELRWLNPIHYGFLEIQRSISDLKDESIYIEVSEEGMGEIDYYTLELFKGRLLLASTQWESGVRVLQKLQSSIIEDLDELSPYYLDMVA